MQSKFNLLILVLVVISSCKKEDPGTNNNNNNHSTPLTGLWYEIPGLVSPDYATSVGPSVWNNNKFHTLVFNKFFRMKYLETNEDKTSTLVSTPFENEQNISYPTMAAEGNKVFVAYNLYLGDTRVHSFLRDGNSWTVLPEIAAPGYSFANFTLAAAILNGQPFLLAQGTDSTYVFTYSNNVWQKVGGKAIGQTFYYADLKANGGRLLALGYRIPTSTNPGLTLKEWNGQQWTDAGFSLTNTSDEIIYPNIDINPSGVALLNYMSYSGSYIYKQDNATASWQKVFERDASSDFAFRARFDKANPPVFYAIRVMHPAQPERAIWGVIKFNGSEVRESLVDLMTDIPNNDVVFNPAIYSTLEMIPHNKKIHFSYTEDRNLKIGHVVLMEEN